MDYYAFIALLMFLSMIVVLITGRHLFAIIGGIASIFVLLLWGSGGVSMPFNSAFTLVNWYPLVTLPIFIFIGYLFSASGISDDLYGLLHIVTGPIRGGLAIGTILLMAIIAAINGLSVAGMSVGCTIALPEMLKRNYDKRMVTGVIQAGSSLGILIPPSVVLVLYSMIARQPVGKLWLAGFLPGLLMAGMFIAYIYVRCLLNPDLGPTLPREEWNISWSERFKALRSGLLPLFIIFMMSGLFFMGITNLVESSAVGAIATIIATVLKGKLKWNLMKNVTRRTLKISCMFLWVVTAAMGFAAIYDGLGAVKALEKVFLGGVLSPWQTIILMQLSFIVMGTFLDDTAMLIIVAPLYVPLVIELGFSPIWYGILYTITCQVAYLTPPFGYNLFLMGGMAPDEITLKDIYISVWPFVLIMVATIIVLMLFPQIATILPNMYY